MHVLIIPSGPFVTEMHPIGGIFQRHQANTLRGAGVQVGVISLGVITMRFLFRQYRYWPYENLDGIPIYRDYKRKFFPQRLENPRKLIRFYQEIGKDLYRKYESCFGKPDVIHAHNFQYAASIAYAISIESKIPYIVTEHSSQFLSEKIDPRIVCSLRNFAQKSSRVTAVSHALANTVKIQIGFSEIDILPNVLDSNFSCQHFFNEKSENRFVFFNAASLDKNKNQAMLIQAFAECFGRKNAHLRIAGTGPLEAKLRRQVKRLSIEDQVCFLGHLDRSSIMREMGEANCFVLTSFRDTFGVVLIEALSMGTPVIATRSGGPNEIVNENNGILVEPGDVKGLGKAMVQISTTKGSYSPIKLRHECYMRFGEETFLKKVTKLYSEAIVNGCQRV